MNAAGVMPFHPGRNINKQRETGRVTFGESIFSEAANLFEQPLGKLRRIATGIHSFDEFLAELVDHAASPPCAHRPSQLIGLARRKTGCNDGQPHCLFLEDGNAQRFLQHVSNALIGKLDRFFPAAAA